MTFWLTLNENFANYSDKPALELMNDDGTQTVTYGELGDWVEQTAVFLQQLGVQPGDRVGIQLPKGLPFILLHLATMRLGAVSLPLNPAYPAAELHYFLADAETAVFFGDTSREPELAPMLATLPSVQAIFVDGTAEEVISDKLKVKSAKPIHNSQFIIHNSQFPIPDPQTTALMIYTSGTTGRPKGAMISHGNLTANIEGLHTAWGWQPDDVLLHVLPIFHVHGLVVALHGALHAGATAVLLPKFDADQAWQTLVARRCTVFMAVPTIHRLMVSHPHANQYDLSHMRLITSGSDRLPDDLFHQSEAVYGQPLLERYGMTETGMNMSNPLHGERRVGSVGRPLPGVEARVVDPATERPLPDGEVGEVQIRGPHVTAGYWRQPGKTAAAFTADGWLRTGDMGMRAADGYFTLKGRSKDLIISGGYNVYPPEVELVLAEHPAVATSAVIGCADEKWGERVTAVVVPKPNAAADPADIIDFCKQHLANYKVPKRVIIVAKLPRNALGKVQKAQLRADLCDSA